ncbi:putative snRNA-activating protein complex subunit [Hibiscus syriacus]|uniref:snRNA-activating protein complex subunit n=1 Tax=Hibiscus syriacus TaxID=106335 RepID=A0A6A2ZE48_HIBSY|nr:probable E3 ubiquitin-protein ligase WAVH2 [Hibiscus syriacus]KAE8689810.1 putative snRNA-activating protein complex subunit [Hibiscus syriacus]
MGAGSTTSSKLRKVAKKTLVAACGSFSRNTPLPPPPMSVSPLKPKSKLEPESAGIEAEFTTNHKDVTSRNICAICLEALSYSSGSSPGQAIFTAQCSHAFHFSCISSNVRHGSITCPICRAHWTQLPRHVNPPACSLSCNQNDPVFRILDDSIATFRVHRRSFLRSASYDDDDPIEPVDTQNHPRIDLALIPLQPTVLTHPCYFRHQPSSHSSLQMQGIGHISNHHHHHFSSSSSSTLQLQPPSGQIPCNMCSSPNCRPAYLSIKFAHPQAMDMVLFASPNGPHLRLLKQSMALVVFSLRPINRLAIVTYSSASARVFPLRRMTSYGKRTALQVIDRLFYMGQADPVEGLKKGIKILEDRAHKNPQSCILHLSDSPTRSYHAMNLQFPIPIHRFHVGFGFGTSNGFVMHEFEEFLTQLLGGVVREVQLRIGEEGRIIRLGDLRGGEERRILMDLGECLHVCVGYSYIEGGSDECIKTGETMVSVEDKRETDDSSRGSGISIVGGRTSSVENWDYHDPYMARRWAKHLHGYRF